MEVLQQFLQFCRQFLRGFYRCGQRLCVVWLIFFLAFADWTYVVPVIPWAEWLTPKTAVAIGGDFAIFREATGTETVLGDGTPLDVTWDTAVSSDGGITLDGNNSDIDLSEGGKYLVLYNVWTEQGTSTAGSNRRSLESYLTLGGTELAYGRGDGYIRDSDNDFYAFNNGAAIIDATAGQDLQVHIKRDDTNSGAGSNIRADSNGVSVLKLDDTYDYLRIYKDTRSADISGNTTFTDVTWDESDEVDTGSFGFSNGSTDITLKGSDGAYFLVTTNVALNQDVNSGTRQNYELRLTLDGKEIPGTRVTTYPRGNASGNGILNGTLVYTGLIRKTSASDQTLQVEVKRESQGGASTDIVANETALSAVALPDSGHYISLTSTSTSQALSTTRTAFQWNEQFDVATTAFSHSTTSNNSRINIDLDGDFLMFSTAHASRTNTTNGNRAVPVIEWRLDGSTVVNYGGHGSFNRGNQSTTDSYTSGSSGGVILAGLSDTQYLEVTAYEALNNTTNTDFNPHLIAVQGVELRTLFATDVTVSATGTHAANVDFPSIDNELGGTYIITENTSSRNLTSVTFTESGTIDASTGLDNIELWYDFDTSFPYDCADESYNGDEAQYGSTDTSGFSGPNGVSSFSDSVSITTTQTFCGYIVYDVASSSNDSETIIVSIVDPTTDVGITGGGDIGPSALVAPAANTTIRNAELTLTHYRWLNDDGVEGSATAIENEDTAAVGFANGTTRRLRLQVDAAGSTSSLPTTFQLDYATKTASCALATTWINVGDSGGVWDMANSLLIVDGTNATNIATTSGGLTDPDGPPTFLTLNGALRDTNSQTAALTVADDEFLEFEFAIEPTATAPQGNTYCFRLSDNGTALRNYSVYAEGTISADIDVSASSSQVVSLTASTTDQYVGGTFVVERSGTSRTLNAITITETGTVDATRLPNPRLFYDLDTSAPHDCTGESYSGAETSVSGGAFTSANGSSSFTSLGISLSSSQSLCGYIVFDIASTAPNGDTINIEISNPSTDVDVSASSVGPSTPVSPTGSTTIAGLIREQAGYHWRNDNGNETGATSATGATENTPLSDTPKNQTTRVRILIDNAGGINVNNNQYRLEYGTKVTSCSAVSGWTDVGDTGGAFDMSDSTNLTDGNNTTNIGTTTPGGVSDPTGQSFLSSNGGVKDTSSQTGNISLTTSQFVELEYSIIATDDAGDDTTYCFRVTNAGSILEQYTQYPELTTREKQDFYIQRGTATITGTSTTLIAGTDYEIPAASTSAFIRITNSGMTGAGENVDEDQNQTANGVTAYIEDGENILNSVTVARPSDTANANNTRVSLEIIEFTGIPGTDNEMIVRDHGSVTFGASALYATGTALSNVADDSDVVVFITGQYNPDGGVGDYNTGLATASWHSTSGVPVFQRGEAGNDAVRISYAVVEFTGLNWKIQRAEHQYSAAGSTETESITAVTAPDQAFIHAQKRVGAGLQGLDEFGHQVWLSGVGQVSFALRSGANTPSSHVAVAWVIENTQTGTGAMDVHRTDQQIASGGAEPESNVIGIGATVDPDNASIFVTNDSSGAGTAYPRPILGARILNSTQYELWNSDTGQNQSYRTAVVEWPVAEISVRQNYYRFYVDNDALDPTDPWPVGASDLGENTSITALDEPVGESERVRVRMTLNINNANLPADTETFKLQYSRLTEVTCSALSSWNDVGGISSGSIWRGYNGAPADGADLSGDPPSVGDLNISVADVAGTYEEENNSNLNPFAVGIGEDVEYDWVIEHNGAIEKTDYCFRVVYADGSTLDGYDNYPTIRTAGYAPVVSNWRWYDDEINETPTSPLADENSAPTEVANQNIIKLRTSVAEINGANGNNTKFKLQYSEYADFSTEVYDVHSTSGCTFNSLWCYGDGVDIDNATVTATVISDSASCVAGVGDGCGTHNEGTTTPATAFTHQANTTTEFEFTIQHAGARAGAVYYFRLYDTANDEAVLASSTYPSLVTEGAQLTFSVNGLPAGTVTEGVVTDATTTPTSIYFDSVAIDTEYEAAHRLTVNTNATEGYKILTFIDQQLISSSGSEIDPVTGSNSSPVGWNTGCLTSAIGCFGYHAGDDTLEGGSARFGASDTYASFSTSTPEEVLYSSVPTNESHDMVYKLEVSEMQPAGNYEATITYIAIPVF